MLNWVVWNKIVFDIENVCKKTILILNRIVWNRTVSDIETSFNCFK